MIGAGLLASAAGGSTKLFGPAYLLVAPGRSSSQLTIQVVPSCCAPPLSLDPQHAWTMQVYAPAAFVPDLGLPPGTPIGTVGAPPSSRLTVGDPAAFADDVCARGRHAAVWTGEPIVSGHRVFVRVLVDRVAGDEAAYGAYRLTVCDAPFLVFRLRGVLTTPTAAGVYTWRAFVTTLNPSTRAPLPDSTVEMRAIVPIPHVLHVKTTYVVRSQTLVFSGRVTAAGEPDANSGVYIDRTQGVRYPIELDGTTRPDGTFTIHEHARQGRTPKTLYFDAYTWKDERCTTPSPVRGCGQLTSSATLSFTATIPSRRLPTLSSRP